MGLEVFTAFLESDESRILPIPKSSLNSNPFGI